MPISWRSRIGGAEACGVLKRGLILETIPLARKRRRGEQDR
jgi:hypothetical protein